ncbi:hypothetical protein ANN_19552 [Periplaneta americana]|uniref:C2H2-type domain-containing protein n=1 Tax=Periplaneta americana TaxID=6978 RepID=A0ABQ8SA79_PERAM|nr:hypothetical protein ANN_19552 [Periplaneta americana]
MLSSKKKSDKNTITNVISKISNVSDKPLTSYIVQDKDEIKKGDCVKKSKARTRGEKKGFLCQDCGKNFSYEQHLLLHRRSHTGEKPFSCSVCSERFSVSSNLNKHMRIHTGEKPFLCTVCGKNFSRSDTLSKHMRSHTGEKPFHCAVCGNNFGRRSILTNHMRTHSGEKPYLCTECGQRFAQSYDLTKHTRSHTGEKPYHCTLCRMSFGQRNSLTKHMNSHPKEMPFPCLDFSKGFPYKMDSTKLLSHTEPVKLLAHSYNTKDDTVPPPIPKKDHAKRTKKNREKIKNKQEQIIQIEKGKLEEATGAIEELLKKREAKREAGKISVHCSNTEYRHEGIGRPLQQDTQQTRTTNSSQRRDAAQTTIGDNAEKHLQEEDIKKAIKP